MLRLGTCVLANGYRHPTMLAKALATLDVLAGRRIEVGPDTGATAGGAIMISPVSSSISPRAACLARKERLSASGGAVSNQPSAFSSVC